MHQLFGYGLSHHFKMKYSSCIVNLLLIFWKFVNFYFILQRKRLSIYPEKTRDFQTFYVSYILTYFGTSKLWYFWILMDAFSCHINAVARKNRRKIYPRSVTCISLISAHECQTALSFDKIYTFCMVPIMFYCTSLYFGKVNKQNFS